MDSDHKERNWFFFFGNESKWIASFFCGCFVDWVYEFPGQIKLLFHDLKGIKGINYRDDCGTEIPGFSGDGGLAISAQLNQPQGMVVDLNEDVFICDSQNDNRIKK